METHNVLLSKPIVESRNERLKDEQARQDSKEERRTQEQHRQTSQNPEIPLPPNPSPSSSRALRSPLLLALNSPHPPFRSEGLLLDSPGLDDGDAPEGSGEGVDGRVGSSWEERPGEEAEDGERESSEGVEAEEGEVEGEGGSELEESGGRAGSRESSAISEMQSRRAVVGRETEDLNVRA